MSLGIEGGVNSPTIDRGLKGLLMVRDNVKSLERGWGRERGGRVKGGHGM